MNDDLLHYYLLMKKSILLDYSISLYKIYDFGNQKFWNGDEEFSNVMDSILNVYINKYFLRNESELKSVNVNNLGDYDFKMTLSLAVIADYFGEDYQKYKDTYQKAIYNLALILYVVTNIDKEISFYNKKGVSIKSIVSSINILFKPALQNVDLTQKPFVFESLADKIKNSERREIRFFESLKDSESFLSYIKYYENSYLVKYNFNIKSLEKYDEHDINKSLEDNSVKNILNNITFDLVLINILKMYANNCDVPYFLLNINSSHFKKKNNVKYFLDIFSNPAIKDKVVVRIDYLDYKNNFNDFSFLTSNGFKFVMYNDMNINKFNLSQYKLDFKLYCDNQFEEVDNKNIIVLKDLVEIYEDILIDECIRKESNNV